MSEWPAGQRDQRRVSRALVVVIARTYWRKSLVDQPHELSDTSCVPKNNRVMQQDARLTIRLPGKLREALGVLARAEQRSVSAQVLKILDDAVTSEAALASIEAYRKRAATFEEAMFGEPLATPRYKRRTKR